MQPSDFDRLVARASNPRLIPGIYNYCDRWCERCGFTDRCLQFLEDQDAEPPSADAESLAGRVRESLTRRLGTITEIARREHIDLRTIDAPSFDASEKRARHGQDPLVAWARQYGDLAWRLALARPPKPSETAAMLDFLKREPLEQMCRVIFNLNEFVYAD